MTLMVDTSVWSLAFRRDAEGGEPEVRRLRHALDNGESIVSTGLILQELLQGFAAPKAAKSIVERFSVLPLLSPDRTDHIEAAELRNLCRRRGVQIGTIDAVLARLCMRYALTMLTTDHDFTHVATHCALAVWKSAADD